MKTERILTFPVSLRPSTLIVQGHGVDSQTVLLFKNKKEIGKLQLGIVEEERIVSLEGEGAGHDSVASEVGGLLETQHYHVACITPL